MFHLDSNGVVNATVTIPRGFTGHHTLEVRVVNPGNHAELAPQLNAELAATTTRVMMPFTVGKAGSMSGTSGAASPSADTSNLGSVAVIGIGALGVVLLAGGGLLMFAGRRRRELV
jgi:hypothetical protein